MSGSLDRFLDPEDEPNDLAPEPAAPEPEPQEPEPEAPEPEPDEPEGQAPAEPEEPQRDHKGRLVPLRVVEDERGKRQAAEAERDKVRAELEAFKRQQQAPQEQRQPPPPIDPSVDPQGFVSRVQEVMLNERLNTSELMLRRELGAEKVEAAINEFREAAKEDPSLFPKLYSQPDPYAWMAKQVEMMRLQRDIGSDPASYRERIVAEERAKWEAEQKAHLTTFPSNRPVSPAAGMQPSVGRARSVAGRMVADDTDMPIGDILRR